MASAVLGNQNERNWPRIRGNSASGGRGVGGGYMGKVPCSNHNPNPNFNKKQFHGEINGFQMDESPAVTQSASDDASSINHHRRSSKPVDFNQFVSFNIAAYSRKELAELKNRLITELELIRQLKDRIDSGKLSLRPDYAKKASKTYGNKRHFPSSNFGKDFLNRSNSEIGNLMKSCSQILTKLMKHKHGWIFNKPVDVVSLGLHDYYDVIKRPMDLGTVKSKLSKNVYASPTDFAADVRLTFTNAMTYNPKGHDVHIMADQLLTRFEELFRPMSEKLEEEERQPQLQQQLQDRVYDEDLQASSWNHVEVERVNNIPMQIPKKSEQIHAPSSSSNPSLVQSPVKTPSPVRVQPVKPVKQPKPKAKDPNKREMSLEEKHRLGLGLQSLPQEKMEQVVQIIKKRNGHLKQDGDEIELDIEAVDTETLWELDRLVTNWKKMVSKIKRQALMGNTMTMNSTPNKANGMGPEIEKIEVGSVAKKLRKAEAGEEDVDIGDEMPTSTFPPVEIDKDAAAGGGGGHGGCSSSSGSSSSDDSSSSSDSDSEGSSSSRSDSDDNAEP